MRADGRFGQEKEHSTDSGNSMNECALCDMKEDGTDLNILKSIYRKSLKCLE